MGRHLPNLDVATPAGLRQVRSVTRLRLLAWVPSLLAAACTPAPPPAWSGYVEGDYVYVASPLGGSLQQLAVHRGQAVVAKAGEWVRYSTPGADGAEYVAVCLPAFTPDTVHRDRDA